MSGTLELLGKVYGISVPIDEHGEAIEGLLTNERKAKKIEYATWNKQ